ncbi:MAG: leucine-rich repeat domain-containing protein [Ruminococcus sp.]|nr:leucine-rich repeat domain-containing protein [Ruminococcus sp.]
MKKLLIVSFIAALICFLNPAEASCAECGSITYTVIDGEVTVTGYTGAPEIIEIPQFIEGIPVTSVRDNAFYCCTSLRKMILPDTVRNMGHHCFYGCTGLEEITLPARLSELGMGCFEGCAMLKKVQLPDTLTVIPDSCFRRCSSLTTVIIPQNVTDIEKFCFCACTSLYYVSFGGRLKTVGTGAFYQCTVLDTVYIPPSVTDIGAEALGYTTGGKSTGMTVIGERGSAAEEYAKDNGAVFSASPETVQAFDPAASENAPVKLPPVLAAVGGLLFLLTGLIALKQTLSGRKR